jgi:putative endonuclease
MDRQFYVYMLANRPYGTLYVGITNELLKRVWQHKSDLVEGFTREHQVHDLVWYEVHSTAYEAITREKTIKRWHRDWKVNLIQRMNPRWEDLYPALAGN